MAGGIARESLEAELRRLAEAGDFLAVATRGVNEYGPEIHGFLVALAHANDDVDEVYARFCEKLWRALPGFRWECSFRTWVYLLARYVLIDLAVEAERRIDAVPISQEARTLAAQPRSSTSPYQRSEVKDRFVQLRDQLEPDERTLLILRVDRDLAWREIAAVMDASAPALRKRFERVKERLKELALAEGLIDGDVTVSRCR